MESLQSLLKFQPWVHLVEVLGKQCVSREASYVKTPITDMEAAFRRNYEMGVVAGIRLSIAFPTTLERIAKEEFDKLIEEEQGNVS